MHDAGDSAIDDEKTKMNMRNRGMIWGIVLLAMGCQDIFEKDLSEKEVQLIAPADSVKTEYESLTFAWTELEGAAGYRLVIVSPSFAGAERYLLDTLVEGHRYSCRLQPGRYQWAVRPENSAYEGVYRERTLTVVQKDEVRTP